MTKRLFCDMCDKEMLSQPAVFEHSDGGIIQREDLCQECSELILKAIKTYPAEDIKK